MADYIHLATEQGHLHVQLGVSFDTLEVDVQHIGLEGVELHIAQQHLGRFLVQLHLQNGGVEGLFRHDVAGRDALLDHVHHRGTGVEAVDQLVVAHRSLGTGVGQAHAHGLDGAGHGVGGVHTAAGAFAWDGVLLDVRKLLVADLATKIDRRSPLFLLVLIF